MRKLMLVLLLLPILDGCAPQGTEGVAGQAGNLVLREGFEADPNTAGWIGEKEYAGARTPFTGQWVRGAAAEGNACISVAKGMWTGPALAVTPQQFYRLTFASRGHSGYWVMRFFDANGAELNADNYSTIYESSDWVRNDVCVMARDGAAKAMIGFRANGGEVFVDDVKLAAIGRADALAWADALYQALPPVSLSPQADRFKDLPRTMAKLRAAQELRIVTLGDSIANDMSNSHFQLLIERMYPGAKITLIHAIRGNTGCWYYEKDNMVQPYVLDHQPDLVIIGGISHGGNSSCVRNVIKQVRAKQPDVEFLFMTGAMIEPGMNYGWIQKGLSHPSADVYKRARDGETKFYNDLVAVRDADRFATLDLRDAWEKYIQTCGRPRDYFQRDFIHSNDRGKQIMGRLLAEFFRPE